MTNNTNKHQRESEESEAMEVDDNESSHHSSTIGITKRASESFNDSGDRAKRRKYTTEFEHQNNNAPEENGFQRNSYNRNRGNRGGWGYYRGSNRGGNSNQSYQNTTQRDDSLPRWQGRGNRSYSRGNGGHHHNQAPYQAEQQPTADHAVQSSKPYHYSIPQQPSKNYEFSQSALTFGNSFQAANGSQQQFHSRGNMHPASRSQRPAGQESARDRDFRLSKAMVFLLRHGAVKARLPIQPDGYIYVINLLQHRDLWGFSEADVERVVQNNNKQRFQMTTDGPTGKVKVRASQGHSIPVEELELEPIVLTSEEPIESIVHGTYRESLKKILETGLSRMNRNHIHFTTSEPEDKRVTSGMRASCEVVIYIDITSAVKDGFKFFRSANGVILSPGNNEGILPKKYFLKIFQRNPRKEIFFNGESSDLYKL